jgi:Fuc2NAc and GlcNAc transferase
MIFLVAVLFAVSFAGTGWIRRYCLASGIVDIPNQRSSHSRIVARGGGIGFSGLFILAVLGLGIAGVVPGRAATGLAGGGTIVALTGWVDDRKGLTQVTRIVLHLAAAGWAVVWLGPVPSIVSGSAIWIWITQVAGVIAFAWMINLYNFMDGTDGIAGVEAVTVAVASGFLCAMAGLAAPGQVYWLLAAAAAGFLVWNWPPARIFMGDAGSGFLGFVFAALALWTCVNDVRLFWPCVILLSVFVADATATLMRRMLAREKWYEPHSTHAYQKLARRNGHLPIALGVAIINITVLAPVAWMAWLHPALGLPLAIAVNGALAAVALSVRDKGQAAATRAKRRS